jgi:uncharacterized protein involved in response to NO
VSPGPDKSAACDATLLIGGRIIPSFARNWLIRQTAGRLPRPFDLPRWRLRAHAFFWVVVPNAALTAWLSLTAAGLHGWRLIRWAGERTWREPLVLILHFGYDSDGV